MPRSDFDAVLNAAGALLAREGETAVARAVADVRLGMAAGPVRDSADVLRQFHAGVFQAGESTSAHDLRRAVTPEADRPVVRELFTPLLQ